MIDLTALKTALDQHGPVTRVVVARVQGSAPREVGAAMLVGPKGLIDGTIGGGALEFEAIAAAQAMAQNMAQTIAQAQSSRRALGPDLGQCCGGAVTLAFDPILDMPQPKGGVIARRIDGAETPPLSVTRALAQIRNGTAPVQTQLIDGWLIDPVLTPQTDVWLWGAGHVGRAIANMIAPLPDINLTWIDTAPDRFPDAPAPGITILPAAIPERLAAHAPVQAHHLVLTYSHVMDLAICDALLRHQFASAGVIGSRTKWARFRKRLSAMNHRPARIDAITCPIGDPSLGKHPQEIAVGVVTRLLKERQAQQDAKRDMTG